MVWTIEYDVAVRKSVEKMDRQMRQRIKTFLQERIAGLEDPRQSGKALKGSSLGNFWCYRVGDYRIICDIQDRRLVVLVIEIGHRREIYR